MSGAMSLVAVLLLLAQIAELIACEKTRNYDQRHLSRVHSPLFRSIIVEYVEPNVHIPRINGTRIEDRKKKSPARKQFGGQLDDYFNQFADSIIFVNMMKKNLEKTIREVENSTQRLQFKIRLPHLAQMKYMIVDLMSTFQFYKLQFSHMYDKAFDFYLMGGTGTGDVLSEDLLENVASYGLYSDVFYHVLKFKTLRDLYSSNVRDTTNATWPSNLGDIPPDGIVSELSDNVMASLGDVISVSKIVELIFSSQLPIHNGPEWDNAYPGTVYKLMMSTKYYIMSLVSHKMVPTINAIKRSEVELSDNVVNILTNMARHRILNALMHKTMLRIFTRMKDLESFMKTGDNRESPISKRYFEPITDNSEYNRKRRSGVGNGPTPPTSAGDLSPVNRIDTASADRYDIINYSDNGDWLLLKRLLGFFISDINESDEREQLPSPDDGDPESTVLQNRFRNNRVEDHPFKSTIIFKTHSELSAVSPDNPFLVQIHKEMSWISKIIGHEISTYLGKIITKHFITETFGYGPPGVTVWLNFINSGVIFGRNPLIDKIKKFYSLDAFRTSIAFILNSFGLSSNYVIDQNDVHAMIKASMPFAFVGIREYLKTLNERTSRTYIRFRNLMPIFEVVKVKLNFEDTVVTNSVNSLCEGRENNRYNIYLAYLQGKRYKKKLVKSLTNFVYNNILFMFRDGNLWVEDFYWNDSHSAVRQRIFLSMEDLLRKANFTQAKRPGHFDTLTDLKIVDAFMSRCHIRFVHFICDKFPKLYVPRVPAVFLALVNGFIEARILPAMCREHDYWKRNSGNTTIVA